MAHKLSIAFAMSRIHPNRQGRWYVLLRSHLLREMTLPSKLKRSAILLTRFRFVVTARILLRNGIWFQMTTSNWKYIASSEGKVTFMNVVSASGINAAEN